MGDLSSSDCSWKKMVFAKANNEWSSTLKSEHETVSATDMVCKRQDIPPECVKIENDDNYGQAEYHTESANADAEDIDPLSLLVLDKRKRRKSSGVSNTESPEARATRLAKMSAYAAQRLANESPEQRALRLRRMSAYAAKRLADETSEQRAKRLSRMSAYAAKRLANESPEQRQARLARMSAYAARRLAMKKISGSNSRGFPNDERYKHIP